MADIKSRKEGKHQSHEDLDFWAEDGLIVIEDKRNGDFNVVTCSDFAKRAKAINLEAKRASYPSDRDNLNDWVVKMHTVWKEARAQGDPSDLEVVKSRHRERRKAVLITGLW